MLNVATKDGRPALRGELDMLTAPELRAWLDQFEGQATEIDLSGVTFFDSVTLGVFLGARERNSLLRVVNPSDAVLRVLEITGTLDYFTTGHA